MWQLISPKEKKLYYLIESLYYAEVPLTLKELAEKIGTSKRSISSYIEELKERVEKSNGALISQSEGYELVLSDNISIDYFQHKLMQSSTGLRLLECLLFNDEMTAYELEKELYISSSSLSRLITKLKGALIDYGLFLDTHHYRIKGDEFLIRRFYTTYFIEAYGYQAWPFNSIDSNEVSDIMTSLLRCPSIKTDTVNFHKFKIFSAVSIVRESKSHDIYQSNLTELVTNREEYNEIYHHVANQLDSLSLPSAKKEQYTRLYTYYMVYYSRSYMDIKISPSDAAKRNTIITDLKEISQSFNLPPADFSQIIEKLNEVLYQHSKMTYSKALNNFLLFEPRDYSLLKIYSNQYPIFYTTLNDFLHNICADYGLDESKVNTDELLYIILSRWDQLSLHLYQNYSTCRLLVYSPLSLRHADSIASFLKAKLERACLVDVFSDPLLSEDMLEKYDFDILVCTSSVSLFIDQPVITLHRHFSDYHLLPLFRAIDNSISANRQKQQQPLEKTLL